MASIITDNRQNPAVRCVTSSKLPICDDAKLPIKEVYGLVDVVVPIQVPQNEFARIAFNIPNPTTANNVFWDAATNEFVTQCAGNYTLSYDLLIVDGTDTNGNTFIAVNSATATGPAGNPAVPVRFAGQRFTSVTSSEIANMSGATTVPLVVGDRVGVYVSDDGNNAAVEVASNGRFSIHSLIGNFA